MAKLPTLATPDPTLEAADRALEELQESRFSNRLGASQIGHECERALFYSFRWVTRPRFKADTLKRFADGHVGEEIVIKRLARIEGVEIPEESFQHETTAVDNHFVSKIDFMILGLKQAPKTYHCGEVKITEKTRELEKAKEKYGEKDALKAWNEIYYAQAQIGMHQEGVDRHYLIAATPGVRKEISVRTNLDKNEAKRLLDKARRVIYATRAPERIGGETYYKCRFCDHSPVCHQEELPEVTCRSCISSTPIEDGKWKCERYNRILTTDDQKEACGSHIYRPDLIHMEQIDAGESWVKYRRIDGSEWTDGTNETT